MTYCLNASQESNIRLALILSNNCWHTGSHVTNRISENAQLVLWEPETLETWFCMGSSGMVVQADLAIIFVRKRNKNDEN